jgi:hypothetical protein
MQRFLTAQYAHVVGATALDLDCRITVPISRRMLTRAAPSPPAVRDCVFEQIAFAVAGEYALNCTHLRTD